MTQKEKLYTEYLQLMQELSTLQGEDPKKWADKLTSRNFSSAAADYKLADLHKMVSDARKSISNQINKNEIQKWYGTPDGIRYKAERVRNIEKFKAELKKINTAAKKHIDHIVETVCGKQWEVITFSGTGSGSLSIGLVKEHSEGGWPIAHFGKTFEIRFAAAHTNFDNKKDEFQMSFGSCGSFDIVEEPLQTEYVCGMGRFLGNKYMLENLREYLLEVSRKGYEINKKLWDEEKLMKTPELFAAKA